jgi:hypothetical protein
MNMQISRLGLRGIGGRKPTWRWNKKNGKLARNSKEVLTGGDTSRFEALALNYSASS